MNPFTDKDIRQALEEKAIRHSVLQRRGVDAVIAALKSEEATLVLLERDNSHPDLNEIRKLCLEKNRNVLVENTQDKENVVRFAIPSKENPSFITNYLCNIFPDVFVNKVEENIPNPVLSKLKVNITKRYTL